MSEAIIRSAIELRQRDIRARQLADFAVAAAAEQVRKEPLYDPSSKPEAYAHDVARLATTILIERIYTDDRELAELRSQLERLADQSLNFLTTQSPAMFVTFADVGAIETAILAELRRQADVDECGVLYVSEEGDELELGEGGADGRAITIDGDVNVTKIAAAVHQVTTDGGKS